MAEWLVEEGIAEHRAVQLDGDRIIQARMDWPGRLAAGWIIEARLIARSAENGRGTAIAASGQHILVDRLPKGASEGAMLRLVITRAALDGLGRFKRAQGRPTDRELVQPTLAKRLAAAGDAVRCVRQFRGTDWDAIIDEALGAEIAFAGGNLLFTPTPAMTTVDIDGFLAPHPLALAAVTPLATTLRRFDLGGSVVIDFPSLVDKADRRAVDMALGQALAGWPHERTGMNGFGLVQIVSRLQRPSLLHLASYRRPDFVWRRLLRRAEALAGQGSLELTVHPVLRSVAQGEHIAALERRSGRRVLLRIDPGLALEAPHAQLLANG